MRIRVNRMKTIKVSLEDLIETTIDIVVEHYVDSYVNLVVK